MLFSSPGQLQSRKFHEVTHDQVNLEGRLMLRRPLSRRILALFAVIGSSHVADLPVSPNANVIQTPFSA
jgi:hypothetical protein